MIWSCQHLPVAGLIFVPNDEIGAEPLYPPVRVRLDELLHELYPSHIAYPQQHDGKVAGDAVAPKARLSATIAGDDAADGAVQLVAVKDAAGKPVVELRVGLGRIELPEHHLALGNDFAARSERSTSATVPKVARSEIWQVRASVSAKSIV
jgi:hypothetical protein